MNDQTTILMVAAGTLAALAFVAVQISTRKSSRQHSLGDMYKPTPKESLPPTARN